MKKLLLIMILLCGALRAQEKASDNNHQPALTIYNQNFFVAREYVPLDLAPGVNRAQYAGIAAHLEPDSVILRDPAGRALQVLEQNYRNDPISQELLLSFYEGKTLEFQVQPNQIIKGKVVRSGYIPSTYYAQNYQQPSYTQPIIEVDGVLRFGLPGQPLFPALSADSILKPTLSWLLETNDPGKFDAEISYVAGGMSWQADYNLVVSDNPKGKTDLLDMVGWITMRNQSGKTFENASIKLMAGDINKIQPGTLPSRAYGAMNKAMDESVAARSSARNRSTNFICTPCSGPPRCATRKPSRWSSCAPPAFTPCACMSTTERKCSSTATTTWSRSARTRVMAHSPTPKSG